mgnify:FL=1
MKITITRDNDLSVCPGSMEEEVAQNIRVLLETVKYDVPLARDMGLDADYLHKPQPVAETLLYQSIADAIETYEPRAELVDIDFSVDAESGAIIPVVEVDINE